MKDGICCYQGISDCRISHDFVRSGFVYSSQCIWAAIVAASADADT